MSISADKQTPLHVAIIMDGNGRWAQKRGLPRIAGHREGAQAVQRTLRSAGRLGVTHLTLFGFSSENWRRPKTEIDDLMGLLRRYLKSEAAELHSRNVRFRIIGERWRLSSDIQSLVADVEKTTSQNDALTLTLALSYGGRSEIVDAARRIAQSAKLGLIDPDAINENMFDSYLWTGGMPAPDVLIRTSGEQRISNFLLWQCAYSEFVFTDRLWPDFGEEDLELALSDFRQRNRRFGARASTA